MGYFVTDRSLAVNKLEVFTVLAEKIKYTNPDIKRPIITTKTSIIAIIFNFPPLFSI